MKQRPIETAEQLAKAAADILNLEPNLPIVISITEGKSIRSSAQNARYWADLTMMLNDIRHAVESVSEHTGYTPLETKRILASELEPEQVAILYATKPEIIHDVLKQICNIPTSTRLGTKDFMRFEDILEATIAEITGTIKATAMRALS